MIVDFSNIFVIIFLAGTFLSFIINQILEYIDYSARKKNAGKIPEVFNSIPLAAETFDQQKLVKITEYENAKYFLWLPSSVASMLLSVALVVFGFFPFVFNLVTGWVGFPSAILNSFLCFFLFNLLSGIPEAILGLPFGLYKEFVLEKKFGFSKMTFKLWLTDLLKGGIISVILNALLTFIASVFFVKTPNQWWWMLAAVLIAFTFIMQVIYPKFIAPLFNKFEPLPEGDVKAKITEILDKTGFKNGGLFVMDASKRSGHSNAYFSGLGKSKRIVLYDTLMKSLTADELASVLGHELGHFKLKHITKRLFLMIPLEFIVTYVIFRLARLPYMYNGFGFANINAGNVTFVQFLGLFLVMMIWSGLTEVLSPVLNYGSRKHEYQADAFATKVCGTSEHLINGLIKLNSDNLSELFPPAIYVFWNYSHPTLVQRIKALKKLEELKK